MAEIYFSGQGKVYAGDRDGSGNVTKYRYVGNVPSMTVSLETDVLEHKESTTGQRLNDLRLTREKTASISMTLEAFNIKNLQLLLYGTTDNLGSGTSTDEVLTDSLAVGDIVGVENGHVTAWTLIEDSLSAALTLNTHYEIVDDTAGLIRILNNAAFTQPYQATYNYAQQDRVQMFEASDIERFLQFSGLNTADSDNEVIVELYRVSFDPVGSLDLINDELAQFELEGSILYDATRDLDAALGGFGRIIRPQ